MNYRQKMEYLHGNHVEANEFVSREIRIWGDDYIDELISSGYVPVKLSNGKWLWLMPTKVASSVR